MASAMRRRPVVERIGRARVRELVHFYGLALDAVRPLGAEAVGIAIGMGRVRAGRVLRGGLWRGHDEARSVIRLVELCWAGAPLAPGCAIVPPIDFRAIIEALMADGWRQSAIGRRTRIPEPTLCKWRYGIRKPSWILGEEFLRHACEILPDAGFPEPLA